MDFEKIQHISFTTTEDAIKIAHFLKGLGFKLKKECFEKSTYVNEYSFIPVLLDGLRYDSFTKYNKEWRLTNNNSHMFTFATTGKTLIRREKLKRLNEISKNEK